MKTTDFLPLRTRIRDKSTTIQDVKHREDHSKASFVHLYRDLAVNGAELIEQFVDFYSPGCFLKIKSPLKGKCKNGLKNTETKHLLMITEPIINLLSLEIARRKTRGLAFCFEEISAIFSNLFLLSNHLHYSENIPKHLPKQPIDWISSILILENFVIKALPSPGLFSENPILRGLKSLSNAFVFEKGFTAFLEKGSLYKSYTELIALTILLENISTLDKDIIFTSLDFTTLVSFIANQDISQFWESLVIKYSNDEYISQSVNTHHQKITLEEMTALLDPNETNDPPFDFEIYEEIRKKFSNGCLTGQDKRYPVLGGESELSTDEPLEIEKAHLQHDDISGRFFKNISLSKQLSVLNLISCKIDVELLKILLETEMKQLQHLDLSNLIVDADFTPNIFGSEGLNLLVQSGDLLSQLKSLKLRANGLENKAVINLVTSQHVGGLEVLDLGYNDDLTNTAYYEIRNSKTLTALEELVLSGCRLGDIGLYYLLISTDLPTIESIMDFTDDQANNQEEFKEWLQIINKEITGFKEELANNKDVLPTVFNLKRLRVDVCSLGGYSLGLICCSNAFTQLDELDLSFANLQEADYKFFDLVPGAKQKFQNIKHLNLRSTELKDSSSQLLAELLDGALVEELNLDENSEFDASLLTKIELPKLKTLRLEFFNRKINTDVFNKYAFSENLTDIRISFTSFDGVLNLQSNLSERKVSKIKRCLLGASDLSEQLVTTLVNTPLLRDCYFLDLSMNSLKPSFFSSLTINIPYLTNLKYLNLSGNKLTLPDVRIIWKHPALRQVEILSLSSCGLDGKALRLMIKGTALAVLDFLVLGENDFTLPDLKKYALKLPKTIKYLDVAGPKIDSCLADFIRFAQKKERQMKIKWFIPSVAPTPA